MAELFGTRKVLGVKTGARSGCDTESNGPHGLISLTAVTGDGADLHLGTIAVLSEISRTITLMHGNWHC